MEFWKEKWLSNYRGEGDCAELEKRTKDLDYGNRKGVTFLPWAIVDRIFAMQGGEYELLKQDGSVVEVDTVLENEEIDSNGQVSQTFIKSYFINIRAKWLGRVYTERYPLQDGAGNPLRFWSQNELNRAYQRGKTKAIAIISGIGYKLFEDGDLQFDASEKTKTVEKSETISVKTQPKVSNPPKVIKSEEPIKSIEEPEKAEGLDKVEETELGEEASVKDVPPRIEMDNDIKQSFLTGGSVKAAKIKSFLKEKDVGKISELSEEDTITLWKALK
jgi:hypothetical protein